MKTMETKRVLDALAALSQEHRLAVFRLLVEHAPEGLSAGLIAERLSLAAGHAVVPSEGAFARRAHRIASGRPLHLV